MADDFKIDPSNPITWIVGGLLALVGIAAAAGMNKPAGGGGPVTSTSTMTDSSPPPAKKSGCGCSAHS